MQEGISQKEKITAFLAGICAGLVILGLALYQIPQIRERIDWRVDIATTFIRGVLDPVHPLPAASVSAHAEPPIQDTTVAPTAQATATQTRAVLTSTQPSPLNTATFTATPAPTFTPTPLPNRVELPAPAYEKQDINNCGPATLAMNLRFYGWSGNQKTISNLIKPKSEDRNVNVEELVSYVNTEVPGLEIQYRVGGDIQTLKRILAAGYPVTIEEAFIMQEGYWPNDDRWAGHYLLLTGYDDAQQVFITQDVYVKPNLLVPYQTLDHNWKAFNRVYLMVYPPDQRSAIQSILGDQWDVKINRQHAEDIAREEIKKDSTDSFAWFNLGTNLVYFEKYSQAATAYDNARDDGLPQRMLRYQFGPFFAYFNTGRNDDLLLLTEYALGRTPTSEEAMLWRGWALYRQGNKADAEKFFLKALDARPGYPDAQYALKFIREN